MSSLFRTLLSATPTSFQSMFARSAATSASGAALPPLSTTPAPALAEGGKYPDEIASFPQHVTAYIHEYLESLTDRDIPVVKFASPDEIKDAFKAAGCELDIADDAQPKSPAALLEGIKVAGDYSVRTGSPFFYNQLYARVDPVALAGDFAASAMNTNLHTYEVAPVFTVMEHALLSKIARWVGPGFASGYEGLFVPGGSIANLYGMQMARFKKDPDFKKRGAVGGPRLVAFTSQQSHYSYLKSTVLLGLGTDNLVKVECDGQGRMKPDALAAEIEKAKSEGGVPFFVGATAGTTVLGAFDDFAAISEVCKKNDMWMHIDGAWGGSALLSKNHRDLCAGADLADSFCWNAHKMMGVPLQCSAFLTTHQGILKECNATKASYLFQPDKHFTELDMGDLTVTCGRHNDPMKLFFLISAYGDAGLQAHVDKAIDLADYMDQAIINDSDGKFLQAFPRSFTNVSFFYIPKSMRPYSFETATPEQNEKINKVAVKIKDRMQREGTAMIGFQPLDGRPNFFRMVFASASIVTKEDVDRVLAKIDEYGRDLE